MAKSLSFFIPNCSSNNNNKGVCCDRDTASICTIETRSECESNNYGLYYGDGTSCFSGICDGPPKGACCNNSSCTVDSQQACEADGGSYQGDGTSCSNDTCS